MSNLSALSNVTVPTPIPVLSARQNELLIRFQKVAELQSQLTQLTEATVKVTQSVFTFFDLKNIDDSAINSVDIDSVNFLGSGSNKSNFFIYGELGVQGNSKRLTPVMVGLKSNQYGFFLGEYRAQLAKQGLTFSAPMSEFELPSNLETCLANGSIFNAQPTCIYVSGVGEFSRENVTALFDVKKRVIFETTCLASALSNTLSYYGDIANEAKKLELEAQIVIAQKMYQKVLTTENIISEAKSAAIAASLAKSAAIAAAKSTKPAAATATLVLFDEAIAKGEKYIDSDTEANDTEANDTEANDTEANDTEAPKPLTRSQRAQQNRVK